MTALTVQLPESTATFVRQQAAAEVFASPEEYLASLATKAQELLEAALVAGLDSGPARPMTRADWDSLRERVIQRAADRPT
jgi:hypothetical protein